MDKVAKREVILKKRASKMFTNPTDALEAFNELVELKESEKSAKRNTRAVKGDTRSAVTARAVENQAETDSRDSFWNSIDVMDLTPEQREHLKAVMRKEV